jgi:PAS domain S-box-containing protein
MVQWPYMTEEERRRLAALAELAVVGTPPEERFDRLTRMAAYAFGVQIAGLGFVDAEREWFKSQHGLPAPSLPRALSACIHAIESDEPFIVPDALADPRFAGHPWVVGEPYVRFYAGCAVAAPGGYKVGAFCLMDGKPRAPSEGDLAALKDFAALAEREIAVKAPEDLRESLRNANEKFSLIFNHLSDAIAVWDAETLKIEAVNIRFMELFQWTREEVPSRTIIDISVERETTEALIKSYDGGGAPLIFIPERRLKRSDGSVFVGNISAGMFMASDRKKYISSIRDITARKETERQVARLNDELTAKVKEVEAANGELKMFSFTLAHDLRAPLRAIRGFSAMLAEAASKDLAREQKELCGRILSASERMDALIEDLLVYSELSRREIALEPIELDDLIAEVLREVREAFPGKKVDFNVAMPLGKALGHPPVLQRAVFNLVSNAVKFVPAGVTPRVRVRSERKERRVRLWVEDNGIGIAAEEAHRLFVPFERLNPGADYPGSGIGLAIVRRSAQRMGGEAGVESAAGEGSRFWLELPAPEVKANG